MSYLAPYTNAMRIGQGFNSYTQEICMTEAVIVQKNEKSLTEPPPPKPDAPKPDVPKTDVSNSTAGPVKLTNGNVATKDAIHLDAPNDSQAPTSGDDTEQSKAPTSDDVKDKHLTKTVEEKEKTPEPWTGVPVVTSPINQIVTFSSRSVENLSEIMDSLNISAYASIKYGTITGAGGASFVNESKVVEADINYIVTVKVTNEIEELGAPMVFNEINPLPGQDFTRVYGDCFIAGFLKGGEFSAIISVKVDDHSKMKQVKAALDLSLATPVPGLTAGGGLHFRHFDDDVWHGTEMTISVNWFGGGMVKKPETIWTLKQVMITANEFPNLVSRAAQRTSAILMRYASIKSFYEKNAARKDPYQLADYSTAGPYTADLFSAYITYKNLWKDISSMLGNPSKYERLNEPGAIGPDPLSLNKARIQCRIAMTRIIKEVDRVAANPEKVIDHLYEPEDDSTDNSSQGDRKEKGLHPSHPLYTFPAVLKARLPQRKGQSSPEVVDIIVNMKPEEILKIQPYVRNDNINFDALVGVRSTSKDNHSFVSVDTEPDKDLGLLTVIHLHTHQHKPIEDFFEESFHDFTGKASKFLTAIGYNTNRDNDNDRITSSSSKHCNCGCLNHVGTKHEPLSQDEQHMSRKGEISSAGITKVVIGFEPRKGWIGSLALYEQGHTVLDWQRDSSIRPDDRLRLQTVTQTAPNHGDSSIDGDGNRSRWILGGFHGEADLLVTRLGAIWIRV